MRAWSLWKSWGYMHVLIVLVCMFIHTYTVLFIHTYTVLHTKTYECILNIRWVRVYKVCAREYIYIRMRLYAHAQHARIHTSMARTGMYAQTHSNMHMQASMCTCMCVSSCLYIIIIIIIITQNSQVLPYVCAYVHAQTCLGEGSTMHVASKQIDMWEILQVHRHRPLVSEIGFCTYMCKTRHACDVINYENDEISACTRRFDARFRTLSVYTLTFFEWAGAHAVMAASHTTSCIARLGKLNGVSFTHRCRQQRGNDLHSLTYVHCDNIWPMH